MVAERVARLMDEIPALQQHFDLQLSEIKSEQRAIRSAVEASREQTNAINSRIETVNNRIQSGDMRMTEILDQVRKTNGRVSDLEKWQSFQDGVRTGSGSSWRILVAGSAVVGTIVGGTVAVIALVIGG